MIDFFLYNFSLIEQKMQVILEIYLEFLVLTFKTLT
jgi:hypothetical protein